MSSGDRRGSRGDFGVGVGARSPCRVGRNSCSSEHQHCQQQPELPGAPWFFGMHQGLSCCVGLLSVLTPGWALPSSPQPHNPLGYKHPDFSESPPAWNAAMDAARKRNDQQPDLDPFFLLHSTNSSSYCDLSRLKLPETSMVDRKSFIPEFQNRGSLVWLWKNVLEEQQSWDWGGLGVPCSLLMVEHKTLAGSLQVATIPRSVVVPGFSSAGKLGMQWVCVN